MLYDAVVNTMSILEQPVTDRVDFPRNIRNEKYE